MDVKDHAVLLAVAGNAATLLGTFIVAAVFYIGSGTHQRLAAHAVADDYWRSGIRWVFTAYSIPMLVALALASLQPIWGTLIFIGLTAVLVAMTVDTGRRVLRRDSSAISRTLKVNEGLTTALVLLSAVLPWVLGGWMPSAASFVPSLLLVLAAGFTSTAALVMTEFDGGSRAARGATAEAPDLEA